MILTHNRHMCPASDRPNFGLFDQERAPCPEPEITVDTGAGLLLGANAGGWAAWGLDPAAATLPLAIDSAMPALQRLREIAAGRGAAASSLEALTFWTARGVVRLLCRVATSGAGHVTVTVVGRDVEPAAREHEAFRQVLRRNGSPDVALDAWLAHELRTRSAPSSPMPRSSRTSTSGRSPTRATRATRATSTTAHVTRCSVVEQQRGDWGDANRSLVPPLAFAELEPVRVVESCLTVARPLAEKAGLVLGAQYAANLPRIVADELSLKQMLLNLLANAIKFARPGDRVTIAVTYQGGGALHICVADTGPGMVPGRAQAPCAKSGSQPAAVKREGAGLGLGLPLTRALAAANGAALAIESEPGHGTRATISVRPGPDRGCASAGLSWTLPPASAAASSALRPGLRQEAVQHRDHLGALADGCGNTLDRTRSNVADGVDAAAAGLKRSQTGTGLLAGQHEALRIQLHAARQPIAVRVCADEQEQMPDRPADFLARTRAAPANRLEHAVAAFQCADLGLRHHLHVGEAGDAVHEIARHAGGQVAPAHDQPHPWQPDWRVTVAWPAELPAPTRAISWSAQSLPSRGEAQ